MTEISFSCKCRLMKIHCRNNASTTSSRFMLNIFSAPLTTVGDCLTRKSTCYRFQGPAFMTDPQSEFRESLRMLPSPSKAFRITWCNSGVETRQQCVHGQDIVYREKYEPHYEACCSAASFGAFCFSMKDSPFDSVVNELFFHLILKLLPKRAVMESLMFPYVVSRHPALPGENLQPQRVPCSCREQETKH